MPITFDLKESDTLIIAFAGANGRMAGRRDDFFQAAGLDDASVVQVHDPLKLCTFVGIPPEYPTFHDVNNALKEVVDTHPHKKLMVIGTSGGGLPALLQGHMLKADQTVIFSGYPCIQLGSISKSDSKLMRTAGKRIEQYQDLYQELEQFLDARNLLKEWNGKTEYHVHVSRYNKSDYRRANQLSTMPHLSIHSHPYTEHGLISMLIRNKRISECFDFPYRKRKTFNDAMRHLRMKLRRLKGRNK